MRRDDSGGASAPESRTRCWSFPAFQAAKVLHRGLTTTTDSRSLARNPLHSDPKNGFHDTIVAGPRLRYRRCGQGTSNPKANPSRNLTPSLPLRNAQPPVQLTSLSGTYATSTYLAAAKKSSKELDGVAKDLQALEKKLKEDAKTADFLSEFRMGGWGGGVCAECGKEGADGGEKTVRPRRRETGRQKFWRIAQEICTGRCAVSSSLCFSTTRTSSCAECFLIRDSLSASFE